MSAEAGTETEHTVTEILSDAAKAVRLAEEYLGEVGKATYGYDPEIVKQIGVERKSLDVFVTQLTQARTITDDGLFIKAIDALRQQAISLQAVSDRIKEVAGDIATAPGIAGYMEQAVTLIAQAIVFIAELPVDETQLQRRGTGQV